MRKRAFAPSTCPRALVSNKIYGKLELTFSALAVNVVIAKSHEAFKYNNQQALDKLN
jgi:hypothetical protein